MRWDVKEIGQNCNYMYTCVLLPHDSLEIPISGQYDPLDIRKVSWNKYIRLAAAFHNITEIIISIHVRGACQ